MHAQVTYWADTPTQSRHWKNCISFPHEGLNRFVFRSNGNSSLCQLLFVSKIFADFDLESHQQCTYDRLVAYDGLSKNAPILGQYCGSRKPGPIISSQNKMFLTFNSDSSVQRKGFRAQHTTGECSQPRNRCPESAWQILWFNCSGGTISRSEKNIRRQTSSYSVALNQAINITDSHRNEESG